jgi:hypothetical protein
VKKVLKISLFLLLVYSVTWIAASKGFFDEVEFGYYEEFYIAKHAVEKSGCVKIEDHTANPDVVLEEVDFGLVTTSGRKVRIVFDTSNMDIEQVCYEPVGLAVSFSTDTVDLLEQEYRIESISGLLQEKNQRIENLQDVLCNLEKLEQLFTANRGNDEIPRISFSDSRKHLHILFEDK